MTEDDLSAEATSARTPSPAEDGPAEIKLTSSASDMLEDHMSAYRQRILSRAAAKSAANQSTDSIDENAVAEALDEFLLDDAEPEIRSIATATYVRAAERQGRVSLLSDLYFIIGIAIAFGGVIYAVPRVIDIPLFQDVQTGLVAVYIGFVFIAASWFLRRRERRRPFSGRGAVELKLEEEIPLRLEFITEWAEVERALKRRHMRIYGSTISKRGLRDIVGDLAERGVISHLEADLFLDALRVRNAVVHEPGSVLVSDAKMQEAMNTIKLIKRSLETG